MSAYSLVVNNTAVDKFFSCEMLPSREVNVISFIPCDAVEKIFVLLFGQFHQKYTFGIIPF